MAIIIIILVTLIVFFAMRLLPGDPLTIYISQSSEQQMSPQQVEQMRIQFGLDKPLMVQYFNWLWGVLQGNLGKSIFYHENVGKLLLERLPITLHLGLTAFVVSAVLGILAGLIAAIRRGNWMDTIVTFFSYIGITIPVFWLGLLLMYVFGLKLHWLPIAGYTSPLDDFWLSTRKVIMPVVCLAITGLAGTTRQMRSSVLEVIAQDYIRTARSKGLRERVIVIRHVLKNSLIPVITLTGMGIGMIFGGSVLVETVFAIPGLGRLLASSIFAQDYVVIQSGTLMISLVIILSNLIVDISYGWLDPRIRYG
jgi:peptide/nickel transport system permease protein